MNINAARVREARKARQWSQEQLADACGLNLRTIQRLEASGNASSESLRALAAAIQERLGNVVILVAALPLWLLSVAGRRDVVSAEAPDAEPTPAKGVNAP